MESFRFSVRKQLTSHLCCRSAPTRAPGSSAAAAAAKAGGRYAGKQPAAAAAPASKQRQKRQRGAKGAAGKEEEGEGGAEQKPAGSEGKDDQGTGEFGFVALDKKQTLRSFAAYADWVKAVHFSDPAPAGKVRRRDGSRVLPAGTGASEAAGEGRLHQPAGSARRPRALADASVAGGEPTVEEMEAEFWRIVESPHSTLESLYGQDLDSGHHGSGFPLPAWRRRLLQQHLGAGVQLPAYADDAERRWAEHPWNINNLPRCSASVLRWGSGGGCRVKGRVRHRGRHKGVHGAQGPQGVQGAHSSW